MPQSRLRQILSLCLLLTLVASGCASATPSPTPAPTLTPTPIPARFEATKCKFAPPKGAIQCGSLFVPEDRTKPNSLLIQLHTAIIRTANPNPAPDPVVYLNGGPGGHALDNLPLLLAVFNDVLASRDLIVFDQRGVGYSSPSLNCPELEDQAYQDLTQNLSREAAQQRFTQAAQACHARLVKEGRDLAAYTSAANAADVNDLRTALGYAEWNLYGVSYGARLALTVMRDFPDGVRSVILDSTYPPQVDVEAKMAGNAERALNLLFQQCAEDAKCNAAYPELRTVFYDTVAQLDTTPIALTLTHPRTKQRYDAIVTGERLIVDLSQLLYFTESLPYLPALIYELHEGRTADLLRGGLDTIAFANDFNSEGMSLSVQCGEETSFTSSQTVATASASVTPRFRDAINQAQVYSELAACMDWGAKQATPIENQPVVSDIPTLILAGSSDPITPPVWGRLAAKTLSRSRFFEFNGVAHAVLGAGVWGDCSQSIVSAFLVDPNSTPDSACLSKLKVFFVTR